MRVLVIGGTEFVSWYIVKAMQQAGHAVTALTRGRSTRLAAIPPDVEHLMCDRKDYDGLERVLDGRAFEAVVDVAYAPTTVEDVSILVNRFDRQIERFLFCSPTAVYSLSTSRPEVAKQPITEDDVTEPVPVRPIRRTSGPSSNTFFARHQRTGFPVVKRPANLRLRPVQQEPSSGLLLRSLFPTGPANSIARRRRVRARLRSRRGLRPGVRAGANKSACCRPRLQLLGRPRLHAALVRRIPEPDRRAAGAPGLDSARPV